MRRIPIRTGSMCLALVVLDVALNAAAADCICRARGQEYELGQSVCLPTPKGARIATCGMVLNNTSWQFSDTPCAVSDAPPLRPAAAVRHDHDHRHGS